jgi:hypothetical protein
MRPARVRRPRPCFGFWPSFVPLARAEAAPGTFMIRLSASS